MHRLAPRRADSTLTACHAKGIIFALIATVLLAACGVSDQGVETLTVAVSTSTTDSAELEGQTLSGTIVVSIEAEGWMRQVRFYLDGEHSLTLTTAPFEFEIDTTTLADGPHAVGIEALMPNGRVRGSEVVDFFVANETSTTPPPSEKEPLDSDLDEPTSTDPDPINRDPTDRESGNFFVAPWGSDDASGTFDEPFFSLGRVAELAEPGDTILLRGGVYDVMGEHAYVTIRMSGAPGAPITIRSYPGERAVIDGHQHSWHPRYEDDGRSVSGHKLFQFNGEYTIWEDITFRNGVGQGFYIIGNHNVYRGIVSHDHHSDGIYLQGSFNLIENCDSFNNYSISNGGNSADGLKMIDGNHVRTLFGPDAETRGNIIRSCRFWNNSDDGLETWSSLDTLIEYTVSWSNGYGPTGNGMGFKLGNSSVRHSGTIIRNSIAFDNIYNFTANGATGVTFLNNTSWRPRGTIGFDLRARSAPEDGSEGRNYAFNNISYDAATLASTTAPTNPGPPPEHTHNSWNLGLHDPGFANLDPNHESFLALKSDSPAIDAGTDVGLPYGGVRPDLGALEYGATLTTTLPQHMHTTLTLAANDTSPIRSTTN